MKNILLGLFAMSSAVSAMETRFSIDPSGIVPDKKYCFICQNNARRLGKIDKPLSVMFSDGQRFDYKAHAACHKQVVDPLLTVIEKNYPVGKVEQKYMHSFLWTLYAQASFSSRTMQKAYADQEVLSNMFKAHLEENNL